MLCLDRKPAALSRHPVSVESWCGVLEELAPPFSPGLAGLLCRGSAPVQIA